MQESVKRIIANNLINSFNHFFRIYESVQVVSTKESLLLSESESVRQNTLEANKECYSEGSLTDQSEKKSINTAPNSLSKIKELRIGNANKVIIGNLNINSIRNKFEQLKETVLKYIDILVVTETKLDETFLESLFLMDGFSKPYRLDRNKNGGRIMIFIRDTISSKILEKHIFSNNFESIFVEFNFRKCKWLLCRTYHPPSQSDEYFLITLIRPLILIVDMIKFCLWWILTQEYRNSA